MLAGSDSVIMALKVGNRRFITFFVIIKGDRHPPKFCTLGLDQFNQDNNKHSLCTEVEFFQIYTVVNLS